MNRRPMERFFLQSETRRMSLCSEVPERFIGKKVSQGFEPTALTGALRS